LKFNTALKSSDVLFKRHDKVTDILGLLTGARIAGTLTIGKVMEAQHSILLTKMLAALLFLNSQVHPITAKVCAQAGLVQVLAVRTTFQNFKPFPGATYAIGPIQIALRSKKKLNHVELT